MGSVFWLCPDFCPFLTASAYTHESDMGHLNEGPHSRQVFLFLARAFYVLVIY